MKRLRIAIFPLVILSLLVAWPGPASAQRGPARAPAGHSVAVHGGPAVRPVAVGRVGHAYPRSAYYPSRGYGYPAYRYGYGYGYGYGYPAYPYGFYPWFGVGYGYPGWSFGFSFGFGGAYPCCWGSAYPYYGYGYPIVDNSGSMRLDVDPKEAAVFVDGYLAGQVDSYDGVFQRLRVPPGSHEITVYMDGYRTVNQNVYFNPGSDQKVQMTLARLTGGEVSEPPPAPRETKSNETQDSSGSTPQTAPRDVQVSVQRFGTLSLRIQPADADILVDGERWSTPSGQDRIAIQLAPGRHSVEVRRAGFSACREDVLIRANATLTLNVSLLTGQ